MSRTMWISRTFGQIGVSSDGFPNSEKPAVGAASLAQRSEDLTNWERSFPLAGEIHADMACVARKLSPPTGTATSTTPESVSSQDNAYPLACRASSFRLETGCCFTAKLLRLRQPCLEVAFGPETQEIAARNGSQRRKTSAKRTRRTE